MKNTTSSLAGFASVVCLGSAFAAFAGDGRIEINQAAALAGGITSCDTPGFPVTICTSGAYLLTSDLSYDSALSAGIVATVDSVSIDLNSMEVRGTNTVTIGPKSWVVDSSQGNSNRGIWVLNQSLVENGRVTASGATGVQLGEFGTARNLTVSKCGGSGILTGSGALVSNVKSQMHLGSGIMVGGVSVANDVVSGYNGSFGLYDYGTGSVLERATAYANGWNGIQVGRAGRLAGFSAVSNGNDGVYAADGAVVDSGASRDNNQNVVGGGCGIRGLGGASYRGVNITAGAGGSAATACTILNAGGNFCQGVACP